MQNTLTVVQYDEANDLYTVEIVERRIEHIPAENFAIFAEHARERPFLMLTDKERAIADIHENYFNEDPRDLIDMSRDY